MKLNVKKVVQRVPRQNFSTKACAIFWGENRPRDAPIGGLLIAIDSRVQQRMYAYIHAKLYSSTRL
jgi:hypothetical protein